MNSLDKVYDFSTGADLGHISDQGIVSTWLGHYDFKIDKIVEGGYLVTDNTTTEIHMLPKYENPELFHEFQDLLQKYLKDLDVLEQGYCISASDISQLMVDDSIGAVSFAFKGEKYFMMLPQDKTKTADIIEFPQSIKSISNKEL